MYKSTVKNKTCATTPVIVVFTVVYKHHYNWDAAIVSYGTYQCLLEQRSNCKPCMEQCLDMAEKSQLEML